MFKLQHLLECNILQHRDDLEEITNSAVKEEQIEIKLAAIESDWAALNLVSLTAGFVVVVTDLDCWRVLVRGCFHVG